MHLHHSFAVPADVETAWTALNDLGRVARCMPGAVLTSVDGDHFEGRVKIRVGPVRLTYEGEGTLLEADVVSRTLRIAASGKELRGQGTASASVEASLAPTGPDLTEVTITTDLDVTGKPAQFGRGVMTDVGQKLLDRFANQLAAQLEGPDVFDPTGAPTAGAIAGDGARTDASAAPASTPGSPAPFSVPPHPWPPRMAGTSTAPPTAEADDEPLDLLEVAGGVIGRRLAPVATALALAIAARAFVRRRR